MTMELKLDGQEFLALNGGPVFKFTEAISSVVNCDTQEESIISDRNFPREAKKAAAVGSKINSVCHGKSCRRS
jgi:predicted 3-demethylubiquinone-9 3-methyltransferase (glyoxalase superfamily)